MSIQIVPMTEAHIEGFHRCLDEVARERRYLGMVEGPPIDSTRRFVEEGLAAGAPQIVAVDGEEVVGWCDITPRQLVGFRHVGRLGMGILAGYRGQGIGRRLMEGALARAREIGLERVELEVFASNTNALALYEKLGFVVEGVRKRSRKLDGNYDDNILMAIFL